MSGLRMWFVLECGCNILGISTAAVLCAVGVETLHQTDFYSLAIYLLVSSAGMMLFEITYIIDALLLTWLPYPVNSKFFVIWKTMAHVGCFQKFLYYTVLSVMCFLHPVLVWHAVIPGTMLLLTGLLNFILSKRKKSSPPKESKELDGDLSVHITESEEPEQTFSFFHIMSGRRASYLPNVSKLSNSFDCSEAILGLDLSVQNLHNSMSKGDKVNVYFTKSFKAYETEMEVFDIDPDETTSDKAPMIRM
ncbi:transmembrane protein 72 isoform X2 [Silurus meridionalis]|uniref:transmembrane protein 72 isoform X2 n=1 Tax=Silurus meridionalis TaxID=175797 RepID=UPI001EEB91C5|nr:transmembrane protein 72 isoform X2 [Silurus meridionalis]